LRFAGRGRRGEDQKSLGPPPDTPMNTNALPRSHCELSTRGHERGTSRSLHSIHGAGLDRAVTFYRDVLGLPLKFHSSGWSEFVTGETILALHPASQKNLAGAVELGFNL